MTNKRLKILFLSHRFYPDIGGIESISEMLANSFYEAGHTVKLLTWSEDPTHKAFPYMVIRHPRKRQLFREHYWADVVFENNPCLRLGWPKLFFGRPSVVGLQTWLSPLEHKSVLGDNVKLAWLKGAGKVIACSKAIKRKIWPAALVIGNPYNENAFRIIPGIERDGEFIFVGRLVSDKGADLAIQAIYNIIKSDKNDRSDSAKPVLTIVGDGPERDNLEQLVSDLRLRENVRFAGALRGEEIARVLNKHNILLVTSRWKEPFGIVALEGIACGCLPIVSDGGGLPDAIGNAGISFKSGDIDDLVRAIRKVINDPVLTQQMRDAAPSHLVAHSSSQVSQRYLASIESVVHRINKTNLDTACM